MWKVGGAWIRAQSIGNSLDVEAARVERSGSSSPAFSEEKRNNTSMLQGVKRKSGTDAVQSSIFPQKAEVGAIQFQLEG
ncbi:hypothetical protein ACP70R_032873 [Stipagrostis hirtigluma subsp. patula]